jgi:hypothetical protein
MNEARSLGLGWAVAGVLLLAGCAAAPPNSKPLAPKFYGVWASADSKTQSWLEIEAHRAVNYGVTGRCIATPIDIVAKDRVSVPISALGSGPMTLRLEGSVLVIAGKYATQRFVPALRESICRQSNGTYLPGAPHPASGK